MPVHSATSIISPSPLADRWNAFVARSEPGPVRAAGPLAGLRLTIKDNISVTGQPFTAGHLLFADRRGDGDAEAVRRLTTAGAQFVGMTRTDAGGFGVMTLDVANPVDPDRVVGGSSGGGAAAIAAGMADVALGTDTGGSVRIPAACCGLYGFKPGRGEVPTDGVWPLSPEFDEVGLMASDLGILARAADVLLDRKPRDARPLLRVAVNLAHAEGWQTEVRSTFFGAVETLRTSGLVIVPVSLPDWQRATTAHGTLVLRDAATIYADVWPKHAERLGPAAQRALHAAAELTTSQVQSAEIEAVQIKDEVSRVLETCDAILGPTLPIAVPRRDQRRVQLDGRPVSVHTAILAETCLANLAGLPALAGPAGRNATDAIPLSFQLIATQSNSAALIPWMRALMSVLQR
ncbi:amidase [uncultured Enterovirga sp.]|uniref:amidase n=1 Tax=uncultured Enterovirga sp. TaxID=2026352 RepID=UPI0035C9BB26